VKLPTGINSKFQYVMLIATRAEQLIEGSMPKVRSKHTKPARIAMSEIDAGLVDYRIGPDASLEESQETVQAELE
jgi:DNA-directed RNA polymerase omega subunit